MITLRVRCWLDYSAMTKDQIDRRRYFATAMPCSTPCIPESEAGSERMQTLEGNVVGQVAGKPLA